MQTDAMPGDDPGEVALAFDRAGRPVARLAGRADLGDLAAVLALRPALLERAQAAALSRLVNHFAQGARFEVIADPAAFESAARAQIAAEDPAAPFDQRRPRLRDFGLPDFAAVHPPVADGIRLVFFARDRRLGVPYRVEATVAGPAPARYTPVPTAAIP